jgi:hypothetical protein
MIEFKPREHLIDTLESLLKTFKDDPDEIDWMVDQLFEDGKAELLADNKYPYFGEVKLKDLIDLQNLYFEHLDNRNIALEQSQCRHDYIDDVVDGYMVCTKCDLRKYDSSDY